MTNQFKGRFVFQAANLFNPDSNEKSNPAKHAQFFEAPTVIRYEKDQVLAPHFDANKAASTEDANRGGQTLATLLLYLNDVDNGGNTRFGRLMVENDEALVVKPKMGDALLFFPAGKIVSFFFSIISVFRARKLNDSFSLSFYLSHLQMKSVLLMIV